jgi:hypothetical protein
MARIRSIKPEFWSDDTVTECSLSARLLFIGIWNFADDAGNLDRSHKQIKTRVFPIDNIDCEPLIQELLKHGLLVEYSVGGKKYLHVPGFAKHQLINRPSKPVVPGYQESLSTHGTLTESSMSTHAGGEGKGREGRGEEGRGCATPDSVSPSPNPDPESSSPRFGIRQFGSALSQQTAADSCPDAWRDVGCDPEAMESWLTHLAQLSPPKHLRSHQRIETAKLLAGMGEPEAQRIAVRTCAANGWASIRPSDAGKGGGKRKPYSPQDRITFVPTE